MRLSHDLWERRAIALKLGLANAGWDSVAMLVGSMLIMLGAGARRAAKAATNAV